VRSLQSQIAHPRLTFGQVDRFEMFEDLVIFGVDQRHATQPGDLAHRLQQKTEVGVEPESAIRQKELERTHAESDYRLDLGQGGIRGGGQPGVKSEVDGRIVLRLREPLAYGLQRRAAAGLDSEVNVRGYPATCRRARAGCVIVAGDHAALKHSEMDVRVDARGRSSPRASIVRPSRWAKASATNSSGSGVTSGDSSSSVGNCTGRTASARPAVSASSAPQIAIA